MLRVFEPHITKIKNRFQMRFLRAGFRQQDLILKNLGSYLHNFRYLTCSFRERWYICSRSCCYTLDLQPGDEIILPAFTIISCANAIITHGLVPVFVDVKQTDWVDVQAQLMPS